MRFFTAGGALFIVMFFSPDVVASKVNEKADKTLLLREKEKPESNPQYQRVVGAMGGLASLEKAKILYLITQLKLSPCQFERNGAVDDGTKAASHLLKKYSAVKDRINTAEQFIDYVASRSSMSGQPYYILDKNRKRYPSREVLRNELAELEKRVGKVEPTKPS